MATHSSILAWRIPWMEESGSLLCPSHHDLFDIPKIYKPVPLQSLDICCSLSLEQLFPVSLQDWLSYFIQCDKNVSSSEKPSLTTRDCFSAASSVREDHWSTSVIAGTQQLLKKELLNE